MTRWLALALVLIATAAAALDNFTGPIGGANGVFPGGPEEIPGITGAATGSGGSGPPAGCNGTIDLSQGCVQPMLGVL